jgi:hypothetical protein
VADSAVAVLAAATVVVVVSAALAASAAQTELAETDSAAVARAARMAPVETGSAEPVDSAVRAARAAAFREIVLATDSRARRRAAANSEIFSECLPMAACTT